MVGTLLPGTHHGVTSGEAAASSLRRGRAPTLRSSSAWPPGQSLAAAASVDLLTLLGSPCRLPSGSSPGAASDFDGQEQRAPRSSRPFSPDWRLSCAGRWSPASGLCASSPRNARCAIAARTVLGLVRPGGRSRHSRLRAGLEYRWPPGRIQPGTSISFRGLIDLRRLVVRRMLGWPGCPTRSLAPLRPA